MSRRISMGDNSQYIENGKKVIQNNYISNGYKNLPEEITRDQWIELVDVLKQFIFSDECKKLKVEEFEFIKNEVENLKRVGRKKGWIKFRSMLSDSANMITIIQAIVTFISNHYDKVALWIRNLFGV